MNKKTFPLKEMKIEVTQKCPLACLHCSSDASQTSKIEMSYDKVIEIINSAISLGLQEITFSGGEPLLWSSIIDVIEYSSNRNLNTVLYTTGNVKNYEDIFSEINKKGINKIVFSVFGPDVESHEIVTRRRGSFERTISSIKFTHKLGIKTEIHFVALSRNYSQLVDIAKMSKDIGVDRISVLRFVPQGRGQLLQNDVLKRTQNIELKRIIQNLRKDGYIIRTGSPFNALLVNDDPNCMAGKDRMIITPDLYISPCDAFKRIKAYDIVGSSEYSELNNYSLSDCWVKSNYLSEIRDFLDSEYEEPCLSCKNSIRCLSGCLAQKVIMYGKLIKKPDPICLFH